jgi:hypothetical protein
MMGQDFYNTFKENIDISISKLKKQIQEIEIIDDIAKYNQKYTKLFNDFFFDLSITYVTGSMSYSKDFNDLNSGRNSKYLKLFDNRFSLGKSASPIAGNLYMSYYSIQGNDLILKGDEISYLENKSGKTGDFKYYNDLTTFLNENATYRDFATKWIILILKDVKLKVEQSIKNSDYPSFVQLIRYYNSLPDITLYDEKGIDNYTSLLKDINMLKEKYKDRIIPVKENIIQMIQDNRINYYTLPSFSFVMPYYVNNVQKLSTLRADLKEHNFELNFDLKLVPSLNDEMIAKEISFKSADYVGMYADWSIENFNIKNEGIDENLSSVQKYGDVLKIKLVIKNENKVTFALLFGSGQLFITLSCYSNIDKSFKFKINVPVNFRYRSDNLIKLKKGGIVSNNASYDLLLHGYKNQAGRVILIDPIILKPNESLQLGKEAVSIPVELIECLMGSTLLMNFIYFSDLTDEKNYFREISIKNNFPNRTDRGDFFQSMIIHIEYSNGNFKENSDVEFKIPGEQRFIKIGLPIDNPKFTVSGKLIYENEIISIDPKVFTTWNIILDQSTLKN